MATVTNRTTGANKTASSVAIDFSRMLELGGVLGNNGKPKYRIFSQNGQKAIYGTTEVVNSLSSPFPSFADAMAALRIGQSACVRTKADTFTYFMVKTSDSQSQRARLMFNGKRLVVEKQLTLVGVEAVEDIQAEIDGQTIVVPAGTKVLKAVSDEYLAKLQAA
jgi:hypothetical protein